MAPSEFWKLRPRHFWVLMQVEIDRPRESKPGELTRKERKRLARLLEDD